MRKITIGDGDAIGCHRGWIARNADSDLEQASAAVRQDEGCAEKEAPKANT